MSKRRPMVSGEKRSFEYIVPRRFGERGWMLNDELRTLPARIRERFGPGEWEIVSIYGVRYGKTIRVRVTVGR